MATKDDLKSMLVGFVNAKLNTEDIVEIDIVLKTKNSVINFVERFENNELPIEIPVKKPVEETPVTIPSVISPEHGNVVEPLAPVKKERKKRTPKTPVAEEEKTPVVETVVTSPVVETVAPPTTTAPTKPTGIARIVKLVTFFCKGQNINPADITIALLKEKAFDIIEGYDDATVQSAIDEFKKAMVK